MHYWILKQSIHYMNICYKELFYKQKLGSLTEKECSLKTKSVFISYEIETIVKFTKKNNGIFFLNNILCEAVLYTNAAKIVNNYLFSTYSKLFWVSNIHINVASHNESHYAKGYAIYCLKILNVLKKCQWN